MKHNRLCKGCGRIIRGRSRVIPDRPGDHCGACVRSYAKARGLA